MSSAAIQNWEQNASHYLETIERISILFGSDALRLAKVKAGSKLIDIGCGTGGVAIHASNLGLEVVATDISQGMLDVLTKRNPQIQTIQTDGQTLENIESDQFDYASSIFGIYLFPDRMSGWKSALRVLKQDGIFVTTVWDVYSQEDFMKIMNSVPYVLPENKKPKPYQNGADFRETLPFFQFSDQNLLKKELEESGFRDVECFKLTHSVVMKNRDEIFDSFLKITENVKQAFETLSEEEQLQCRNEYFKIHGFEDSNVAVVLPAVANVAVARK
eukprot:TRINITY_DN6073_c2_g1_i1.p1 TRINITY_DN6073_c2_g1~~TRINITY_DN6073_c2_g1_i1.p1  ORF type:complete len:274 (+),score=50.33 TRINITY_DN6073_c2_g1_i1:180-1001(+)